MTIYIINVISIFIWQLLFVSTKIKYKKELFIFFFSLQLYLLLVFRGLTVGTDIMTYSIRFSIISDASWTDLSDLVEVVDFEYGYILFNKIISIFSSSPRFFIAVSGAFIVFSFGYYIYRESPIPWLSFLTFICMDFFGASFNLNRQMLAISILLFSVNYIKNNRFIPFLFIVLLATTFHTTAFIFLISYPLNKIKFSYKSIISLLAIIIFLTRFSQMIIYSVINLLGYEQHLRVLQTGDGSGRGMLALLFSFLLITMFYGQNKKESFKLNFYLNILTIAILFNILAMDFALMGRVMLYFTVHNIILLPEFCNMIKTKFDKRLVTLLMVFGLLFLYLAIILISDGNGVIPYQLM